MIKGAISPQDYSRLLAFVLDEADSLLLLFGAFVGDEETRR